NKKWGWTADQTLKLIQSLYEKKVTTYPRVDTTYLSTDIYPKISETLRKMAPYAPLTASLLDKPIIKPKRIFDNAKVTDHHAIIPTGVAPNSLVGDERKLYHLIALRFIAAFYPDCVFLQTTVNAKVANVDFKASGKVIIEQGWRSVYQSQTDKADADKNSETGESDAEETENILPDFSIGESGPHKPSIVKKTTQPPKLYTEGTLLRAMESAGKTVEDETLREALKENGIGRPSTRSAIIETLFKRRYIKRQRKSIDCTEAGMQLIDTINQEILKSASLTGIWENRLRLIERGQYTAEEFIGQLKLMISEIVKDVLADNSQRQIIVDQQKQSSDKKSRTNSAKDTKKASTKADGEKKRKAPAVKSLEAIVCPACGQGHIVKGRTAYGCSRYNDGCKMLLPFDKYAADLTPAQLNRKISKLKQ
ncbi:MAG: DNA topoisomerase III, partial [Muribaculaceae bacterium]|nr:DNA topoisomerase III [Muribaculaceae bacterium]